MRMRVICPYVNRMFVTNSKDYNSPALSKHCINPWITSDDISPSSWPQEESTSFSLWSVSIRSILSLLWRSHPWHYDKPPDTAWKPEYLPSTAQQETLRRLHPNAPTTSRSLKESAASAALRCSSFGSTIQLTTDHCITSNNSSFLFSNLLSNSFSSSEHASNGVIYP